MLALSKYVQPEMVLELRATDKNGAFKEMVEAAVAAGHLAEASTFLNKLIEREGQGSTAFGYGVALPHARIEELDDIFLVIGRSKAGIDFESRDGAPVHLVFMSGISSDQAQYLQLISRISWLVRNDKLRDSLITAPSIKDLHHTLSQH
jgi:mannitol/fructose-specific phosphotransferase system IIA component (Ntr-type)